MQLGGSSWRGIDSREYWLAGVYGTQWSEGQIGGNLFGSYLTDRVLGTMQGNALGSYDTFAGSWEAVSLGTFAEQPLALGAEINAAYHFYDGVAGEITSNYGYLTGLLGATESPFASATSLNPGAPVDLLLMGEAAPYGQTTWWGDLTAPYLPEGGALPLGLIGGRTTAHYDYASGSYLLDQESLEGMLLSLYVDKDGNAGTLAGAFAGSFYPFADGAGDNNRGMFIADGSLTATMKASGFDPATAAYNYSPIEGAYAGSLGNGMGSVTAAGGFQDTSWGYLGSYSYWLEKDGVPEPWGIFNLELGGDYQLAEGTPETWALTLGGTSFRGLAREYWLAETTDGTWTETDGDKRIAAGLTGRYMTPTTLGVMNGGVLGSYDTNGQPYNWEAVALGTFEERPLAFVSDLASDDGALLALLGGAESLWTNTNVPVLMMGDWDITSGVWAMPVWSDNFLDGSYTTYQGGAYQGFSTLVADDGQGVDAGLIALYIDPAGNAGYLKGDLSGRAFPDLGLFFAQGSLARTEMEPAPAGMTADSFFVLESGPQALTLAGSPATVGFTSETRNEAWIEGVTSWGIWQSELAGTVPPAAPANWQWETARGTDATYWTNYDVTWVSEASKITGTVAGAAADWVNAATYVSGGDVKGLFNPTTAAWKAVAQGAWMETGKFLELTASNPAALQAMNIPAIQVGSATLTQQGAPVNNLSNVTMADVRFFATSTGSVPKIWATNAVGGNFSAAPSVTGPAVPLAGGGLNANFGINNWGNGTWGANVTGGTGTLSGGSYNGSVNFQGGAAGRIGAGSFNGTGAGIVK